VDEITLETIDVEHSVPFQSLCFQSFLNLGPLSIIRRNDTKVFFVVVVTNQIYDAVDLV
jgi:hypothetical protein